MLIVDLTKWENIMNYCSNCGNKIKEGAKFCDKCGNTIGTATNENSNKTTFTCSHCGTQITNFEGNWVNQPRNFAINVELN